MPEIRECLMHYKHAHHVLVEDFHLGKVQDNIAWTLRGLWADATQAESSKGGKPAVGMTKLHAKGYMDKIGPKCKAVRGQKSHQTRIWPPDFADPKLPLSTLESLVLQGISYTPRSLILKFKELDLQVISLITP
jgi:hypothetical protein